MKFQVVGSAEVVSFVEKEQRYHLRARKYGVQEAYYQLHTPLRL